MPDPLARLTAALADRYTVERELGRGGMATVYLARDVKHDRPVAIKVMRPEIAATLGGERFLREIALAAPLQHPHILTLIDSGDAGGVLYYVMPWVDGETLASRLGRERQLPLDEALRLATEIAEALEYAHRHGVVHRDIKPDNILLAGGHAIVLDFGVARAIGTGDVSRLTNTGIAVGTPAYMSPEQAVGEREMDGRTDIYALGCVLYEMLVGEPPYTGPTPEVVMARRLVEPVPRISVARGTVGPGLEAVIEKALARTPADRWATAAEFATALAAPAIPRGPRNLTRQTVMVLAGVVAVLGAGAAWLLSDRSATHAGPVTLRRFTISGNAVHPSLSPDGRRVAYVTAGKSLVVQDLGSAEPTVLVPPARFLLQPRWTRDGSAILFWMYRDSLVLAGTWMVPSRGGAARQVLDDQSPYDAGPDSTVALRHNRGTHAMELVDLATGRIRASYPLPDSVGEPDFFDGVAWSPDGRLAALSAQGLWILHLRDSTLHRVASEGAAPRWHPSGGRLFYLAGSGGTVDVWQLAIDGATGRALGSPARALSVPHMSGFDVGPSGQLVVEERSSTAQVHVMTVVPGEPGRLSGEHDLETGSTDILQASVSDDGELVAYAREVTGNVVSSPNISRRVSVDVAPAGGGPARTLGPAAASQSAPSWAPDGQHLTVLRTDSGQNFVTLISTSDGSARRIGTRPAVGTYSDWGGATWSADGSRIVYLVSANRLAIVDPARLTETFMHIPDSIGSAFGGQVMSPHGDQVLVSTIRRPTDWGELWFADVATGRWRRAAEPFGNNQPLRWRTDGTIYVGNNRALAGDRGILLTEIWTISADSRPPTLVVGLPDGCESPAISTNGRRVTCVLRRLVTDLLVATDFRPGGP